MKTHDFANGTFWILDDNHILKNRGEFDWFFALPPQEELSEDKKKDWLKTWTGIESSEGVFRISDELKEKDCDYYGKKGHCIPQIEISNIEKIDNGDEFEIPKFNEYMDIEAYVSSDEEIAYVDLTSHPRAMRFRTKLRNASERASKVGSNFAGHYTIKIIGCGTSCSFVTMIDNINGQVYFPDITSAMGEDFNVKSRLLVVNPPWNIYRYCGSECKEIDWLYSIYYKWNEVEKEFKFIKAFKPNINMNIEKIKNENIENGNIENENNKIQMSNQV